MTTKVIARAEEKQYYHYICSEGARTGLAGFTLGLAAAAGLQRFSPAFKQLPFFIKSTFAIYPGLLMISAGANQASHAYQSSVHPELRKRADETQRAVAEMRARESGGQLTKDWLYDHRLPVLGATWATTMAICLKHMRRDTYTTTARKIVQARVLAQATTVLLLLVTAALEAKDRNEGRGKYQQVVGVDERMGEHI